MYSAYVLTEEARNQIIQHIKPSYDKVYAHHVTVEFGIPSDSKLPSPAEVRVTGYIDSGDGLDLLLATVNNEKYRPDGKRYHITLSISSNSDYAPKHSNDVIENTNEDDITISLTSCVLTTVPKLLR